MCSLNQADYCLDHGARAGLLGGLLACTISPSIATPALLLAGAVPASNALTNWLTWWSGDTL